MAGAGGDNDSAKKRSSPISKKNRCHAKHDTKQGRSQLKARGKFEAIKLKEITEANKLDGCLKVGNLVFGRDDKSVELAQVGRGGFFGRLAALGRRR